MRNVMKFARLVILAMVAVLAGVSLIADPAAAKSPVVVVLTVKGIINPVMADYLHKGITAAQKQNAEACVIEMDTPGGLDTSMRGIIQDILSSSVPVVVYIAPKGARAASAGTYITLAAHIAAMSPNTNIGAASPVAMTSSGVENVSSTEEEKIFNDAVAYIRSLAATHDRNADWAEKAVRDAASITETEALNMRVIDLVANDLSDLLKQINGRSVTLADGTDVTLSTGTASPEERPMSWVQEFLLAISDPNIAFILLGLAGVGLWVEIVNPGLVFPGVFGAISLILGLFALGNLPVNIAGALLLALAFVLFLVEALVIPGFGAAGIGGIVSLVIGALILFKGGPMFRVDVWIIVMAAICIAAFFTFIIYKLVRTRRLKILTGHEELVGQTASVRAPLEPEGLVFVNGEIWSAVSEEGSVQANETVVISRVDGLKLFVARIKKEGTK